VNLPIVTFEAQLSVSRDLHFADFELFGDTDLIVLTAGEDRGAGSWSGSPKWEFANPIAEADKEHGVEKGANLNILGVPITVFAGVSGAFGCRVDLDATSGPATISPSMGFPVTTLSAGLTPYLRIRAYGGGGFGWTGVSVGLRGTVTLLEAELPVTGTVAYTGGKSGNLAIGTKAVVNLHTLEGRLEAYAEAFGLDYSVVLDRWPGYGWSKTLFDASASWPIGDWAAVCAVTDCE
jgi:hypothetical protein